VKEAWTSPTRHVDKQTIEMKLSANESKHRPYKGYASNSESKGNEKEGLIILSDEECYTETINRKRQIWELKHELFHKNKMMPICYKVNCMMYTSNGFAIKDSTHNRHKILIF